jgi:hypothetical protein
MVQMERLRNPMTAIGEGSPVARVFPDDGEERSARCVP